MNKKEKILEAALQLLVKNGIHASPMSAIAKAANSGMGTIYNYFPNKEVLINAIYVNIKSQEKEMLLTLNNTEKTKSGFKNYYFAVINFFLKNEVYFLFFEQINNSPVITEESKEFGFQAIEPVINILSRGQKEGVIKKIAVEELLQFIGGTVFANLRWELSQKNNTPSRINNNYFNLLWDALKE